MELLLSLPSAITALQHQSCPERCIDVQKCLLTMSIAAAAGAADAAAVTLSGCLFSQSPGHQWFPPEWSMDGGRRIWMIVDDYRS
jgi:hypothetical protein